LMSLHHMITISLHLVAESVSMVGVVVGNNNNILLLLCKLQSNKSI
jgi:hypothetical protein